MSIERIIRAVAFWIVVGGAAVYALVTVPSPDVTGLALVAVLVLWMVGAIQVAHRGLYGRWLRPREFAPIRPAEE